MAITLGDMPRERVRLFNRSGEPLCEFRASVSRSWVLGGEGRASFTLANIDAACKEKYIQFGNWLLVENSKLPAWVGMIDTPREWKGRTVTVNAYTPERLLTLRRGDVYAKITGATSNTFSYIIRTANTPDEVTPLRVGALTTGQNYYEVIVRPYNLYSLLQELVIQTGEEYAWNPVVSADNKLTVFANWMRQVGIDSRLQLTEGKGGGNVQLGTAAYTEDAPLYNNIYGFGNGSVWHQRPREIVVSNSSIRKYGRREAMIEYNTGDLGVVQSNARSYLNLVKDSRKTYGITALNIDNTFSQLGIGNKVSLSLQSVGFYGIESKVRIVGMMYNPAQGQSIQLALREESLL